MRAQCCLLTFVGLLSSVFFLQFPLFTVAAFLHSE
jgi:hypothetical protein